KTLAKELQKFGFRLVSGGTDNHLILVDLQNKKVTGKEAEAALDKARITVNKNMVPFDTKSPFDPSGIRLGTPAITTRGMKEDEMRQIGSFMNDAITNFKDEAKLKTIAEEVTKLTKSFPLYQ
ncbi:MAG: serine hydroxymethyltransferase, partial [Nanoarchaeota archaeon]